VYVCDDETLNNNTFPCETFIFSFGTKISLIVNEDLKTKKTVPFGGIEQCLYHFLSQSRVSRKTWSHHFYNHVISVFISIPFLSFFVSLSISFLSFSVSVSLSISFLSLSLTFYFCLSIFSCCKVQSIKRTTIFLAVRSIQRKFPVNFHFHVLL
jgi:hypothetical protein